MRCTQIFNMPLSNPYSAISEQQRQGLSSTQTKAIHTRPTAQHTEVTHLSLTHAAARACATSTQSSDTIAFSPGNGPAAPALSLSTDTQNSGCARGTRPTRPTLQRPVSFTQVSSAAGGSRHTCTARTSQQGARSCVLQRTLIVRKGLCCVKAKRTRLWRRGQQCSNRDCCTCVGHTIAVQTSSCVFGMEVHMVVYMAMAEGAPAAASSRGVQDNAGAS